MFDYDGWRRGRRFVIISAILTLMAWSMVLNLIADLNQTGNH